MLDQEFPLYHQMQEDLQQEFESTTSKSPSYCSTPTAGIFRYFYLCKKFYKYLTKSCLTGKAYALQLGQIWHRVIMEKKIKKPMAFFVDTGVREEIEPSMEFHFLPSRYFSSNKALI